MAIESARITADLVDCNDFPEMVQRYQVQGVPKIVFNDVVQLLGAQPEAVFVDAIRRATGIDRSGDLSLG